MTEIIENRGKAIRATKSSAPKAGGSHGASGPVIRSAVGVVRESVDLLNDVAGFGTVPISDARQPAPGRQAPPQLRADERCANVIPFPMPSKRNRN